MIADIMEAADCKSFAAAVLNTVSTAFYQREIELAVSLA